MQRQRRDKRQAVVVNRNQAGKRVCAYQLVGYTLGGGAVFGGEMGGQVHGELILPPRMVLQAIKDSLLPDDPAGELPVTVATSLPHGQA